MNKLSLFLATAALMALPATGFAADPQAASKPGAPQAAARSGQVGIAAIVNEDIITFSDVSNRMQLYLGGAPLPPEPARAEMQQKILNKLIDEKLSMQEAKTLGLTVPEDQIQDAFKNIAAQNNMPPEDFKKRLEGSGVRIDTLYDQIRSDIAWSLVARRKLRPQINVSETEIDREIAAGNTGEALAPAAPPLKPGDALVQIKQLVLPFAPEDPETIIVAKVRRAVDLKAEIKSCDDMDKKMVEFKSSGTKDMGMGPLSAVAPPLRAAIQNLKIGELSNPIRGQNGVAVLMVCAREEATAEKIATPAPNGAESTATPAPDSAEVVRDRVANQLGTQRLLKMQERYMRDLRATAFIDKRI
jgi:peptidyl-prolyl cis-trans isomerase SurA